MNMIQWWFWFYLFCHTLCCSTGPSRFSLLRIYLNPILKVVLEYKCCSILRAELLDSILVVQRINVVNSTNIISTCHCDRHDHDPWISFVCLKRAPKECLTLTKNIPRMDRGSGNFYIMKVTNKRVARVNLACDENLKADWAQVWAWAQDVSKHFDSNRWFGDEWKQHKLGNLCSSAVSHNPKPLWYVFVFFEHLMPWFVWYRIIMNLRPIYNKHVRIRIKSIETLDIQIQSISLWCLLSTWTCLAAGEWQAAGCQHHLGQERPPKSATTWVQRGWLFSNTVPC